MVDSFDYQSLALKAVATGMIITGGVIWSKIKPPPPLMMKSADYKKQSIIIDEKNCIHSSQFAKTPSVSRGKFTNMKTLYDLFQCGLGHGENEPCLGYKINPTSHTYHWLTYIEVEENAKQTGAGIITLLQQSPGQNTNIGIFMKNCPEWVFVEQSCTRYSMVLVPLYDTLGEESCKYIINHVKCEVVFVDTCKKVDFLMDSKANLPNLKYVVMVNEIENSLILKGNDVGLKIYKFSDILESGKANPVPLMLPKPTDTSSVMFTSGTTGIPKGCVITHESMLTSLASALNMSEVIQFGTKIETHLSFLPLTHVYERMVHILMFMYTGRIAFFSGEIRLLGDEMKVIKPTILFAVPRILNRVYDKVISILSQSPWKFYLYNMGLRAKLKEVRQGIIRRNSVWDYIIFKKIQEILGGNIDIIMVGSAPVSSDVVNFFRAVMGSLVIEGYGQTETTGPVTLTLPGDHDPGHVGIPVPECLIKLCDVPDLNLIVSRDQKGEVCVKGKMCIREYYGDPEMSKALIDSEGWLHTGDVGLWTEKGQLRIVDRCKHIFKLAQGEYIAPERLENIYSLSTLVAQIFVTGDSLRDYCVAIVVPDLDGWRTIDEKYNSIENICNDSQAQKIIEEDLNIVGRKNKLLGFEIVKKVKLSSKIMTLENGLLTPTLKLKRAETSKFFSEEVKSLYE